MIKINAQGLEKSLRHKKDGFTYFGCPTLAPNVKNNTFVIRYMIIIYYIFIFLIKLIL